MARYLIISFIIITASALSAQASEWRQLGYGTLNGVRFDVYIDSKATLRVGDQVRFWQGHVFYADQQLPSGAGYIRVSIEREGGCEQKSAKTLRALFYSRDGSVVYDYGGDSTGNKPVSPDTIDTKALEYACALNNPNREGISR